MTLCDHYVSVSYMVRCWSTAGTNRVAYLKSLVLTDSGLSDLGVLCVYIHVIEVVDLPFLLLKAYSHCTLSGIEFNTLFTPLVQSSILYHYHGSLTLQPCIENVN